MTHKSNIAVVVAPLPLGPSETTIIAFTNYSKRRLKEAQGECEWKWVLDNSSESTSWKRELKRKDFGASLSHGSSHMSLTHDSWNLLMFSFFMSTSESFGV